MPLWPIEGGGKRTNPKERKGGGMEGGLMQGFQLVGSTFLLRPQHQATKKKAGKRRKRIQPGEGWGLVTRL